MGAMNTRRLPLTLAIILVLAVTYSKAEAGCQKGCSKPEGTLLRYNAGHVYEYAFDSVMTVGSKTANEEDDSSLKLVGTAKVFAEGNCGYTLQLSNIKVTSTKEAIEKKIMVGIQKPVHFTMVDGKVDSEICVDAGDNGFALNVKRSVISMLQSAQSSDTEVDIFGKCPTQTSVTQSGSRHIVTKVRNLNQCSSREKINSGIIKGIVDEGAGLKSTSILHAEFLKEIRVEQGVIEDVYMTEKYTIGGGKEHGIPDVSAVVVTTLKVKNLSGTAANVPATGAKTSGIIFEKPSYGLTSNIAALKKAFTDLVNLLDNYVQKNSAESFTELIRLMRNSNTEALLELAQFPHPNQVLARKVYFDALFRTATSESAKAIIQQLNKLSDKERTFALLSFNLVQTVDKEVVTQASNLLNNNAQQEVFLAVGSLVAKYCAANKCTQGDLEAISKKFTDNLKHCKANTRKDEERYIYVLKGIANTHSQLANGLSAKLAECAEAGRSNRIRLAALQSFSAASCNPVLQQKALSILRDYNEDAELRIEAYLAAINCPTEQLAKDIAEIVNAEEINQVGNFIVSNLKVIRDSTDATREHQRQFLANVVVNKIFKKDYKRYSFNHELSYKFNELGFGASSDYRLIYSQHGFLPRSARLNITAEVFGTDFNLLEASIRQENLEGLLEYYFGPKGLMNKDFEETLQEFEAGGIGQRRRRSLADDSTKFLKKYKNNYGNKLDQNLNLDFSIKLFGSEMMFLSLGDDIPATLNDVIELLSGVFDGIKKDLTSFNKEYTTHNLFLDTELVYPTGLGIPLELSTQGFTANKLDLSCSINIDSILDNWQRTTYSVKVLPSTDVSINVKFGFNALVLSTGLTLSSSMHSATGSGITLQFADDGTGFNMDMEVPREQIELIDVQAKVNFFIAEQDKETRFLPIKTPKANKSKNDFNACFSPDVDLGVSVCVTSNVVGSQLDLSKPQHFSLYIQCERHYNLKGSHRVKSGNTKSWLLEYSTPKSQNLHHHSLEFEVGSSPQMFARVVLSSSQSRDSWEGGFTNDNKEAVFYGQVDENGQIWRSKIGVKKNGNEYYPLIEVKGSSGVTNDIFGYRADGKIVVERGAEKQNKYKFVNLRVTNSKNEHVTVNGWVDLQPMMLSNNLEIAFGQERAYAVESELKLLYGDYAFGMFVHKINTPDRVFGGAAHVKFSEESANVMLNVKALAWEFNSHNDVRFSKADKTQKAKTYLLSHECSLKHNQNVITKVKMNGAIEEHHKINLHLEGSHHTKVFSVLVNFASNKNARHEYSLELNGKLNSHFINLISKCTDNGSRYKIDNALTTSWGTALNVKGEIGTRVTLQDVYIDVKTVGRISTEKPPMQLVLSVTGAAAKTTSSLKFVNDNTEVVNFNAEVQHSQEKINSGTIAVIVKDIWTAKGDFKVAKNGKGEFKVTFEPQKHTAEMGKMEVNTKFHVQAPKFDAETSITFEKLDPVTFKTENIVDKTKFTTKNSLNLGGQHATFEANAALKGDLTSNGELQTGFEFVAFNGGALEGSLKRKLTTNPKNGLVNANTEFQLIHKQQQTAAKRTLSATLRSEKINIREYEFSTDLQIAFVNFDGKKHEAKVNMKHLPKGQTKFVTIGVVATSDYVKNPINIALTVDDYDRHHAVVHANCKCGELSADFNGNYNIAAGKSATVEMNANVQAPGSNFEFLEFKSNLKIKKSTTENSHNVIELQVEEKSAISKTHVGAQLKGSPKHASVSVNIDSDKFEGPFKLEGSFEQEFSDTTSKHRQQKYAFNTFWANKFVKTSANVDFDMAGTANLEYVLNTSFESASDIKFNAHCTSLDANSYLIKLQATEKANVYTVESKFYNSIAKQGLHIHVSTPTGPPTVLLGMYELIADRKSALHIEVENFLDLNLKARVEALYKSIEEFHLIATCDAPRLKLRQVQYDMQFQSKTILITVKDADGVILSGTGSYALKNEKNKYILEGQGKVQYSGKSQNANFKLISQKHEMESDNEVGYSYTFNSNVGQKNGVSYLKITNKDFNLKMSVCEEKKQCTNVQMQSVVTLDKQDLSQSQHSLLVLLDLRELGYPYEFELQSKTIKKDLLIQYSLDSKIISNNNMKYQFLVNAAPHSAKIQFNLPKREILLETKQQYPPNGQIFGVYENVAVLYLDKLNKPSHVTSFTSKAELTKLANVGIMAKSELKFEHPEIRPLTIAGTLTANQEKQKLDSEIVFDLFREPEQKLIVSSHYQSIPREKSYSAALTNSIHSKGLGIRYVHGVTAELNIESRIVTLNSQISSDGETKASASLSSSDKHVDLVITALNEELVQLQGELSHHKHAVKVDSKLKLFAGTPMELVGQFQPSHAKVTLSRPDIGSVLLEAKVGKELHLTISNNNKNVVEGRLALDAEHFLQPEFNSHSEDLKALMEKIVSETKAERIRTVEKFQKKSEVLREKLGTQLKLARTNIPDFSPLKNHYFTTLQEIENELKLDPSFEKFHAACKEIHNKVVRIATDVQKTATEMFEQQYRLFTAELEKFERFLKDTLLPAWEEWLVSATQVIADLQEHAMASVGKIWHSLSELIQKYLPQIRTVLQTGSEPLKVVNEVFEEWYKAIARIVDELIGDIEELISKLPPCAELQKLAAETLEKMELKETFLKFAKDLVDHLHMLDQTPETQEILTKIHKYIVAKLNSETVDDFELLKEVSHLIANVVRTVWDNIFKDSGVYPLLVTDGFGPMTNILPAAIQKISHINKVLAFRSSVMNFIVNEDWSRVLSKESLMAWISFGQFDLRGHIADGHHIFTFDGRYLSFPGSCKYILAQDSVDNNFTVVAHLNNGKLKAITLLDREGSSLEVNDVTALKSNNNPTEYPHHSEGMHAWRLHYTVWLQSEYGVEIMCTNDLKVCHIDVNGFYTGKVRGILGNGNAEYFDDFVVPDGKITPSQSTLVNSYALGKCNPISYEMRADISPADVCTEMFGLSSPLALGYLSVDHVPYKRACDNAVAENGVKDKESAACTIATAYASAVKQNHDFIVLPSKCLKCTGAAAQRELDQEFTVKVPSNKADIVFVVDLGVEPELLKNLATPLVKDIRNTLKSRGFTDANIVVVAFNESERYPAVITSDNGKLNYQGNLGEVKLNGPKLFCESCFSQMTSNDKKFYGVYQLVERIVKSVIPKSNDIAFKFALNYPFRAAAAKSIIGITNKPVQMDNWLNFIRARFAMAATNYDSITLHVIAPVEGLSLEGVPSEKLIGFNARLVSTLEGKDAKKRSKLNYQSDIGIDFVLKNGGWIFSTNHFARFKPQEQEKALNQIMTAITETAFKTEIVSECHCAEVYGIHAQHKCTTKSTNFIANKKFKAPA